MPKYNFCPSDDYRATAPPPFTASGLLAVLSLYPKASIVDSLSSCLVLRTAENDIKSWQHLDLLETLTCHLHSRHGVLSARHVCDI